jgi:hypothetical protein
MPKLILSPGTESRAEEEKVEMNDNVEDEGSKEDDVKVELSKFDDNVLLIDSEEEIDSVLSLKETEDNNPLLVLLSVEDDKVISNVEACVSLDDPVVETEMEDNVLDEGELELVSLEEIVSVNTELDTYSVLVVDGYIVEDIVDEIKLVTELLLYIEVSPDELLPVEDGEDEIDNDDETCVSLDVNVPVDDIEIDENVDEREFEFVSLNEGVMDEYSILVVEGIIVDDIVIDVYKAADDDESITLEV